MFSAILSALGGIGGAIGSFFDFFKYKKLADAIEGKHESEAKAKELKQTLETERKSHTRVKEVEAVSTEVENTPKPVTSRKTRVING